MNLSWSVLALTLIGAQDQPASQTKTPGSPIAITIEINGPDRVRSDSCRKAATAVAVPPGARTAATAIPASATKTATGTKDAKPRKIDDPEPELWPMTLQQAFWVALDNSEIVRMISPCPQLAIGCFESNDEPTDSYSGPIVIAHLSADASIWRFKAEVMAHMRSVEHQYWNLAQAHVQLWAADRAVNLAQDVLKGEQARLKAGRGTIATVDEAAQRLEQFNLDLVTWTSDVITVERQFRNQLGLPPSDNRRIIPVTPPTEQLIEYDWDTCLGEMMENQPDIVQQKLLVRLAELQLLNARCQLLPRLDLDTLIQFNGLGQQLDSQFALMTGAMLKALNPLISDREKIAGPNANPGDTNGFPNWQTGYFIQCPQWGGNRSPWANSRQAGYILRRSRGYLKQVEQQTTHSLARYFLEVRANYKQYKRSCQLRTTAAQRLDAQRASFEEGRTTIDRFLDAISQYCTAAATEAQYRAIYNISLAALAEAKGTLLADRNIVIAEGPRPRKANLQAVQSQPPVPAMAATTAPGPWIKTARPLKWKGTQDLMTVAAAFAPDLPEDAQVPRGAAFTMTPLLSVNDASGFGIKPEVTRTTAKAETSGTVTKALRSTLDIVPPSLQDGHTVEKRSAPN